jgi:restriction endonuclease S subunit
LEGLEVSELMLSELERTKRFDSEFYKKENLQIVAFIKEKGCNNLTDLVDISDGNHMSISDEFIDEGVPYYRGQDIHNFYIENASPICISEEVYNKPLLKRSYLKKDDILLSIVGTIGKVSLVSTNDKATCSCKLAILRPKSKRSSELLAVFLSSKYGQNQIQKFVRGAVQMGLILEDMNQLFVPVFSDDFDTQISDKVYLSKQTLQQSKILYRQAEELLLETIGLKDFQPARENINIKSFSESFLATGRLDAEYYQPKYEEILSKVKQQEYDLLGSLVSIKKSIEPGSDVYSDEGLPFLRVADYNKFGISSPEKKLSNNFCSGSRKLIDSLKPKKETILFSKDGSVGTAYMLREDADFITSGAVLHLTIKNKKVLPEYLTLVLNSEVVQQQAERDAGGSIILHWRMEEIEKVVVPIVDDKIQRRITALIEKSFSLRNESDRLLSDAKDMVEREIEDAADSSPH